MSTKTFPTLNSEQIAFDRGYQFLLGIDEVGRGSLAGPVAVGISVLDAANLATPWPPGLRDSKLLSESARESLFIPVQNWVRGWAVGMASAAEIDEFGIVVGLQLAGERAYSQLQSSGVFGVTATARAGILDGSHNWLTGRLGDVAIRTQVKADRDCVSVAAASVLAKVVRDHMLIELGSESENLVYDWIGNKGYSSPKHLTALRELGPAEQHRKTWLGKILNDDHLF